MEGILQLLFSKNLKTRYLINLRKALPEDLEEIQNLYVNTIENICIKDYNQNQINVWTSSIAEKEKWINKLKNQYFLIAEIENKIVGFGSLANGDYLDFLYVHKDFQGIGIASKLCEELEIESQRQTSSAIFSFVSISARPFFEKRGFKVVEERKNIIQGIEIINFKMVKLNLSFLK